MYEVCIYIVQLPACVNRYVRCSFDGIVLRVPAGDTGELSEVMQWMSDLAAHLRHTRTCAMP